MSKIRDVIWERRLDDKYQVQRKKVKNSDKWIALQMNCRNKKILRPTPISFEYLQQNRFKVPDVMILNLSHDYQEFYLTLTLSA